MWKKLVVSEQFMRIQGSSFMSFFKVLSLFFFVLLFYVQGKKKHFVLEVKFTIEDKSDCLCFKRM